MNRHVEQANDVIRAYQDLHDARDRLAAEVREIEARTEPRIKAIMSEGDDNNGTLAELRTLSKENMHAKLRLDEMNKKVRQALSAAYAAHSKATGALIEEAGLMSIKRNVRKEDSSDHNEDQSEAPANVDEASDSLY